MTPKSIAYLGIGIAAILAIPLVAMQFTDEVQWTWFDFAVAATVLLAAGLSLQLIARTTRNPRYRFALGIIVAAILIFVWLHLAVGIVPGLPGGS